MVMDLPVPLMNYDPDRSWITDPDPDHPKGTHPETVPSRENIEINISWGGGGAHSPNIPSGRHLWCLLTLSLVLV